MTKVLDQAYWYYDELEDLHCSVEDVRDSFNNMLVLIDLAEFTARECVVIQEVATALEQLDTKMMWLLVAGTERSLARSRELNSSNEL